MMGPPMRIGGRPVVVANGGNCRVMAGSPKKTQVRRTSLSVTPDLDWRMATPSGVDGLDLRIDSRAWFMLAWGGWLVKPEEAQTATAPPFGASSRDSARLVE